MVSTVAFKFNLRRYAEELNSFDRILFLVEQAHWYYEDFVREQNTALRGMKLREFADLMFNKCDTLKRYKVGRYRLPVSKPELSARLLSALETEM